MATLYESVSFLFTFLICTSTSVRVSQEDRIATLEKRVEALENAFDQFEPEFAARYNLNRTCTAPTVVNGESMCKYIKCKKRGTCAKKLKLGSKCSAICNPGFIATPGKDVTLCKEDGGWTVDMQCEIPLLLISGGTVNDAGGSDSSTELLSLYPSQGCDVKFPDMPMVKGSHRRFHNLVYISPEKVLACNGLVSGHEASCDMWSVSNNTWGHHSYPDKGSEDDADDCDTIDNGGRARSFFNYREKCGQDRQKGRYASQVHHVGGDTKVVGGMVYDDAGHAPSSAARIMTIDYKSNQGFMDVWAKGNKLGTKRSFYCAAKIKEMGILAIGGLGKSGHGNTIKKSAEYLQMGRNRNNDLETHPRFADMMFPRSGHACTAVPGNDFRILVTGGTKAFNEPASQDAEMFNWNENSWKKVTSMSSPRFGHALVAVGTKIFAIGGDDRNPNNIQDTIEEFDAKKNTWHTVRARLEKPRADFGFTLVPHSMFAGCVVNDPLNE